jgi:hypothetical protein
MNSRSRVVNGRAPGYKGACVISEAEQRQVYIVITQPSYRGAAALLNSFTCMVSHTANRNITRHPSRQLRDWTGNTRISLSLVCYTPPKPQRPVWALGWLHFCLTHPHPGNPHFFRPRDAAWRQIFPEQSALLSQPGGPASPLVQQLVIVTVALAGVQRKSHNPLAFCDVSPSQQCAVNLVPIQ